MSVPPPPGEPTTESLPPKSDPESVPTVPGDGLIGPYRLLEQIGEGGFGTVWLAERRDPILQRVAVKLLKPGMDSKAVVARFEQERQALAMMDHPGVARIFDAGMTPPDLGSLPYFVMEYVSGVPITEHCDRHKLSIEARLRLFAEVCSAVQHAHHKGIIHRDIKPSNVLVSIHDGTPTPKVIDFGVAKAMTHRLTDQTLFTEHGQLIGTPAYMSPEQAEMTGQDIDTRSDIYSLGVLLYELLTGALPIDPAQLQRAALLEVQRMIREHDPPRPSTRLSSLGEASTASASVRQASPRQLERSLKGDLDWIVMKSLDKDRTRRYSTAAALAEDIERHLHHQPVLAGPPSSLYRVRKFVSRNRTAAVFALTLAIAACASIAGLTIGLTEAQRQRDNALRSQGLLTLMMADMIADPDEAIQVATENIALFDRIGLGSSWEAALAQFVLARALGSAERNQQAVDTYDRSLRLFREVASTPAARLEPLFRDVQGMDKHVGLLGTPAVLTPQSVIEDALVFKAEIEFEYLSDLDAWRSTVLALADEIDQFGDTRPPVSGFMEMSERFWTLYRATEHLPEADAARVLATISRAYEEYFSRSPTLYERFIDRVLGDRTDTARLALAEASLLRMIDRLSAQSPTGELSSTNRAVRKLIETYESWHQLDHDGGYDSRAIQWRDGTSGG